ncbi:MAG TPA: class I SAM-dependent methyltransferase [Candidatus Saccharimonadales bacterium]|nr:class I SAM-dependent methyltransferase [Candidatus Saccharimonadales bacterium]
MDLGPKFIDRTQTVIDYFDLKSAQPGKIAEIGCGTAPFYRLIRQQPALVHLEVVCTDISDQGIMLLPEADRPPFTQSSADDLPFEDESLSGAVMWDVLEHLKEPGQALSEACRVLSPGGFLHVICPNSESWLSNNPDPEKDVYRRDKSHILPPIVTVAFLQSALHDTGFAFELFTRGFPGNELQDQVGLAQMQPASVDSTGTHLVAFARKI